MACDVSPVAMFLKSDGMVNCFQGTIDTNGIFSGVLPELNHHHWIAFCNQCFFLLQSFQFNFFSEHFKTDALQLVHLRGEDSGSKTKFHSFNGFCDIKIWVTFHRPISQYNIMKNVRSQNSTYGHMYGFSRKKEFQNDRYIPDLNISKHDRNSRSREFSWKLVSFFPRRPYFRFEIFIKIKQDRKI